MRSNQPKAVMEAIQELLIFVSVGDEHCDRNHCRTYLVMREIQKDDAYMFYLIYKRLRLFYSGKDVSV